LKPLQEYVRRPISRHCSTSLRVSGMYSGAPLVPLVE
jgi:hypothetical protein